MVRALIHFWLIFTIILTNSSYACDRIHVVKKPRLSGPFLVPWDSIGTPVAPRDIRPDEVDASEDVVFWKVVRNYNDGFFALRRDANSINFVAITGEGFTLLDTDFWTFRESFVPDDVKESTFAAFIEPLPGKDTVVIGTRRELIMFDRRTLSLKSRINVSADYTRGMILFDNDLIFVENHRGRTLVRLGPEGKYVWRRDLTGYVDRGPVVYGKVLIVQTRMGSYGGQTTTAVELDSGKILWSDVIDAYGYGVDFADDAVFCVETDLFLCPQKAEGWVICRNPVNGRRLWEHKQAGSVFHCPLVDKQTCKVFVVFGEGVDNRRGGRDEVVCFDGLKGKILWRSNLDRAAMDNPHYGYRPYRSALGLYGGYVMVVDSMNTVTFFDCDTGDKLKSADLGRFTQLLQFLKTENDLLAPPWILRNKLVIATNRGIVLCPLAKLGL
ncbi:MAG: PQQ-binding-like beta-propeller repeat protein [Sedimentisphaerales bacterium]|nr:PQQ-binding-like beta-propeller repeat protein [Sedimentisphaerales bacterium]